MTNQALTRPAIAGILADEGARDRLIRLALRYGLTSFGPIAVSAAHFLVSLVFLHALSRADFGLFSFLLVVVPFCLSLNGSLLGVSITSRMARSGASEAEVATHLKASLVFASAASAVVFALMIAIKTPAALALVLGLYGGAMMLRWFARSHAYAYQAQLRVVGSDFVYSLVVVGGTVGLAVSHALSLERAGEVLLAGAAASLLPFGPAYLARQFWPGRDGSLAAYRPVWREMTRWSLLGVILTEATANAHAYFVTLISGPGAFALLAVGGLLMRPISLVYSALPDLERPAMARAIAAGEPRRAFRIVKEFRTAIGAMWLATVLLAGAILIWFPHLVLKPGYGVSQALAVFALYVAIMAVRAVRTPESVLLQAACEFEPLARASLWSSAVSLAATLALLLAAGPVASLGGILGGEALMTANILSLSARWRRSHG